MGRRLAHEMKSGGGVSLVAPPPQSVRPSLSMSMAIVWGLFLTLHGLGFEILWHLHRWQPLAVAVAMSGLALLLAAPLLHAETVRGETVVGFGHAIRAHGARLCRRE